MSRALRAVLEMTDPMVERTKGHEHHADSLAVYVQQIIEKEMGDA